MTHINSAAAAGAALSACARDPDIRILRRVSSLDDFPLAPRGAGPFRKIAILDTETTGTDALMDEIIDIAVVTLEVDATGEIVGILSAGQALRDPGVAIPPHISKLTGITDADVRGKTIDLDRLERRLAGADVLVAHNCAFDAAFVENLLPGLAGAAWACSANDFDWLDAGFDGRKLGHLLMQIGRFNGAHRAMADVISLIHLLAHRFSHGGTVLGDLLASAEPDNPLRSNRRPVRSTWCAQGTGLSLGSAPPDLVVRDRRERLRRRGKLVPRARRAVRPRAADDADHLAPAPPLRLFSARVGGHAAACRFLPQRNEVSTPGKGKNASAMTAVT